MNEVTRDHCTDDGDHCMDDGNGAKLGWYDRGDGDGCKGQTTWTNEVSSEGAKERTNGRGT